MRLTLLALLCTCLASSADEVVLTWKVLELRKVAEGVKGPPQPPRTERTLVAHLRHNWIGVREGQKWWIVDLKTERVQLIDLEAKTYDDQPMIAHVHMREAELANRLHLAGALGASLEKKNPITRFDSEALLGLEARGKPALKIVKGEKGAYHFEGREVATIVAGEHDLPARFAPMLERLLLHRASLHPIVRRAAVGRRTWPTSLHWKVAMPGATVAHGWTLSIAYRDAPTKIDRTGLKRVRKIHAPLATLVETLGDRKVATPTKAEVDAAWAKAVAAGNVLDGVLAYFAWSLAVGDPRASEALRTLRPKFIEDPRCKAFFSALGARTAEQAKTAIATLSKIDRTGMEYGHVIDLMIAPMWKGLRQPGKAQPLYIKVLEKHPEMTGAWNDLAAMYAGRYRMVAAWVCWERARALAPRHPMLARLANMEQRLREGRPECFAVKDK